ncbi:unnamed protein product [Didymodactylos carnosus]|uniref:NAD(P)(+)--arginine ADP-ribosyltransferase n=2 Tax=Didymodactylos carnosus TaxID=1234261 RepID=A0A814SVA0_9BILA|nr:unnamed protein product [Didymodactylos carnosus]CAF3916820.1 unnamed protein product [Didymodactylos carnosus]
MIAPSPEPGNKESTVDILYDLCRENQVEKLQNFLTSVDNISILNTIQNLTGSTCLHVACYYGHKEVVQVLLDYGALSSIQNRHNLTAYEESSVDDIKQLFINKRIFYSETDYDHIQWSITGHDLIEKRREFLETIDLYRTYNNSHPIISKLLAEVIHYYLNEHLKNMSPTGNSEDRITEEQIKVIEDYFRKAIDEKDYMKYFIKAYTLTDYFHRILNKHLALYILQYFDQTKDFCSNYRLVNCLVHIVTLLKFHPDIENDLNPYQLNQHILNRSFLSSSIDYRVAKMFAGEGEQPQMRHTSDQRPLQFSCLCQYNIVQNSTAINVQDLSMRPDEKEILILPFAVFKVVNLKRNYIDHSQAAISVEIELEECEDTDGDFESTLLDNTTKPVEEYKKKYKKRKGLYIFIAVLLSIIVLALTLALIFVFVIRKKYLQNDEDPYDSPKNCSNILNRNVWNAVKSISRYDLPIPVSYIVVHELTDLLNNKSVTQQDCARYINALQNYYMNQKGYDDIVYNFIICGDDENDNTSQQQIYTGRGWKSLGAHCITYNSKSLG